MIRLGILFLFTLLHCSVLYAQDTLTVQQAVEYGLKNNYSIIIARNTEQIAKNNNFIGNAGFLPQANLSLNDVHNKTSSTAKFITGTEINRTGVVSSNLSSSALATWTIFDGFSMFITKNRLEELQRLGESQARMNIENTVDQIILTYYSIVQQQKMVGVIQEAINLSQERLKLTRAMESIGTGSKQAILQALVDVNTDSSRLVQQIASVKNYKSDLNRLLAREPSTPFEVKYTIDINTSLSYPDLQEKLNAQNAQLLMARANANVSKYLIGNYRSLLAPTINLFGGYNFSQTQNPVNQTVFSQSKGLTYGITGAWNVFNGGIKSNNIQNAKILSKSGQLQYEDTRLSLQNDLYKFYNNYSSSLQLIKIQQANVAAARQDVEISVGRYKLGNINDIDLRITQQKLIDAENNLLMAQYTAKQAEIELQRLSGQLLNVLP